MRDSMDLPLYAINGRAAVYEFIGRILEKDRYGARKAMGRARSIYEVLHRTLRGELKQAAKRVLSTLDTWEEKFRTQDP